MQYVLCPRCKFKVALNRHVCQTCGLSIPGTHTVSSDVSLSSPKAQKSGFWQKFLGLEAVEKEHKEPGRDEPALGKI